ncbi:MAG: fibronectin type III domain-containing protein [Candidatus Marinimicrobia bacterium]|nr:fibronectin type III domain-containing protein [Candidatus Neomarinimicrobiota bacterium]
MKSNGKFTILVLIALSVSLSVLQCEKEILKVRDDKDVPVLEAEPSVQEIHGTSAIIHWITDEPCSVNVYYGLTDTLTESDTEFRQVHTIMLTSLTPNSDYFYFTASYDAAGNGTLSIPGTFSTPGDTNNYITYGWRAFESDDFIASIQFFTNYLARYSENTEALTGHGWSMVKVDSLTTAISQFNLSVEIDAHNTNAISGLSMAHYLDSNYVECINSIEYLTELDDSYVFNHDSSYDYMDLRLMLLDSYVQTALIDDACNLLLEYEGYWINPDNSSWTIADSIYDNIDDALIFTVQLIKSDIWSSGFP